MANHKYPNAIHHLLMGRAHLDQAKWYFENDEEPAPAFAIGANLLAAQTGELADEAAKVTDEEGRT